MNLAIFDIDGTLTESNEIDDACYVHAFRDVLGIQGVSTDWLAYRFQTDSGLAIEICQRHLGRDPCEAELGVLQSRFLELLSAAANGGRAIREVRGAARALNWLRTQRHWKVAIATGGWCESARFKLAAAGLPIDGIPWASADDALDRLNIVRIAIDRAKQTYRQSIFENVVYIGDGIWDIRAAKALGLGFLGIANGEHAIRHVQEGAACVLSDFSDLAGFASGLELACRYPRSIELVKSCNHPGQLER